MKTGSKAIITLGLVLGFTGSALAQDSLLVNEDFSNGTLGADLGGNQSSDGSGTWATTNASPVYGGTESNKTFQYEHNGIALARHDFDVSSVENFEVTMTNFRVYTPDGELSGPATRFQLNGRGIFDVSEGAFNHNDGYFFQPDADTPSEWTIEWRDSEGTVVLDTIAENELDLGTVSLEVVGDTQKLHWGENSDPVFRNTINNSFGDAAHTAIEYGTFGLGDPERWIGAEFDSYTVVPEPSTYALLFGGSVFAGVLFLRRRRSSR